MDMPAGKRVGPPDVPPVNVAGLRIEAIHWGMERGLGQNGGYIAAYDPPSGRELWTLKVYDVRYAAPMEEDVQDVFIERMDPTSDAGLEVTDERGRRYAVDVSVRSARPLP